MRKAGGWGLYSLRETLAIIQKSSRYTNVCCVLVVLHVDTVCCLLNEGQGRAIYGETLLRHSMISVVSGEVMQGEGRTHLYGILGRDSAFGVATALGASRSGFESLQGQSILQDIQTGCGAHPARWVLEVLGVFASRG